MTVSGTFQGLLLQARLADGSSATPYGTWSVGGAAGMKTKRCTADDDSVTHSSTAAKTDLVLTWTPPSDDVGELEFM